MNFAAAGLRPSEPTPKPPILVLLHGLAADEHDLIGLAPELNPKLYTISLRAPHETGYGGYSWFGIQFLPDGSRLIDEEQAIRSRDALISTLEELPPALGVEPSQVLLGGFSQGAMMAASVLFERPDLIDGAWLMSGRPLPFFTGGPVSSGGLPILAQHGIYDEVLPVEEGRSLAELLRSAGHEVTYTEYPMGHQISQESLREGSEWLDRLILPS